MPGSPIELDDAAVPVAQRAERPRGTRHLALAADEREVRARAVSTRRARRRPSNASTGWRLPFTWNGSSSVGLERASATGRARLRSRGSGPARARAMRRAARFTVSPMTVYVRRYSGADVAGEDRGRGSRRCGAAAGVVRVGDAARGAQSIRSSSSPIGPRHAGDEDDLAAVVVDVGAEERDLVLVGDALRGADELVAARRPATSAPSLREQLVGAVEVQERDRRLAVLGLLVPPVAGGAGRRRDVPAEVERRRAAAGASRSPPRSAAATRRSRSPDPAPRRPAAGGSAAAVASLTTTWPASAAPSMSSACVTPGPVSSSSRCESPTRKQWNGPVCTPADMRSTTGPAEVVRAGRRRAAPCCIPSAAPRRARRDRRR